MNAAGTFWGYSDEWPDAETAKSVIRAREILAAGVTQLAIEKLNNAIDPQNLP